jgi:peptide-methionine (S)-S-oxide reductase
MTNHRLIGVFIMAFSMLGAACQKGYADPQSFPAPKQDLVIAPDAGPQKVVLAGGCFWCTEGVFENTPGVLDVVSGYAGGTAETAKYNVVSGGATDHAEAIEITYDPSKTTYGELLKVFFSIAHDPTTLNRQGPDAGRQYRSAIFFANDDQKRVAEAYIRQLDEAKVFSSPIVTTLEPLTQFYPAEQYHQDFVRNNPNQGYVRQQALPKVEKAKKYAATFGGRAPATQPAK